MKLDVCTEHLVAGGPDDFMEVRHMVVAGCNRAIGRHLATVARDRLGCVKAPWTDPVATAAQKRFLRAHWPGHAERAKGVADVYGIRDDALDSTFLYYQWGVPGCSVAFYPPSACEDRHAVLARNYDFTTGGASELLRGAAVPGEPPATSRPFVLEIHPDVGYPTLTVCSYELLGGATDGINSEGLAVALLADTETLQGNYSPKRTSAVGVSEIQTVRWLLETCRDAAEARAALEATPQHYVDVPCHFIIADRSGDSFVWELGFTERPQATEGRGGILSVTNHLLYEHGRVAAHVAESVSRKATLDGCIADAGLHSRQDIERANRTVAATAPVGEGQYVTGSVARTLWHAFYDVTDATLAIDFYLGEGPDGIRRSDQIRFGLPAEPRPRLPRRVRAPDPTANANCESRG